MCCSCLEVIQYNNCTGARDFIKTYHRTVPVSKTLIRRGISEPGRHFLMRRDAVLSAGVFSIHTLFSHLSSHLAKLLPAKFSSRAGSGAQLQVTAVAAPHGVRLSCPKHLAVLCCRILVKEVLKTEKKAQPNSQALGSWYEQSPSSPA